MTDPETPPAVLSENEPQPDLCTAEPECSPMDDVVLKDDLYYLSFVQFEIEDSVMLVPRYHFMGPSCVLGDPTDDSYTKDQLVSLQDVKIKDFRCLLNVMYPLSTEDLPIPFVNWVSVLDLSTKYKLFKIRKLAFTELQVYQMSAVERITLARSYGHLRWLSSGYVSLAKRSESITFKEAQGLGLAAAIKICQIRQSALEDIAKKREIMTRSRYGSLPEPKKSTENYLAKIDSLFDRELLSIGVTVTDSIDRAIRARSLGIPEWLRYCYLELARRPSGLSEREAERLGLEASITIFQVRESMLHDEDGRSNESEAALKELEYERMVRAKFELELGQVRRDEAAFSGLVLNTAAEMEHEEDPSREATPGFTKKILKKRK